MLKLKKILVIYQPWRRFSKGLHQPMIENLKKLGLKVEFLEVENPPKFQNKNWADKLKNIYHRIVKKDKTYI